MAIAKEQVDQWRLALSGSSGMRPRLPGPLLEIGERGRGALTLADGVVAGTNTKFRALQVIFGQNHRSPRLLDPGNRDGSLIGRKILGRT